MRVIFTIVVSLFLTSCAMADKSANLGGRGFDVVKKDMSSEQRVALVIGNKDYISLNKLKNPINDARAMKDILSKKNFNVIYLENASQLEMEEAIDKFAYKLKNGNGVGMFYYAGHGMEVDGVNYLIPTDARIPSKKYVKSKSVSTDIIVSAMEEAKNRLNILVLDSCRSNPFSRGGTGGLAPINSAKGIYVAYATAPNKVAEDGDGDNGLFTQYLIKNINQSGLKIEDVFKRVRAGVQRDSNGKQIPWSSSSIVGDFYFTLPSINKKQKTNSVIPIANISNNRIWALKKSCSLNNGKGCNDLGIRYEKGEGVTKDKSKAVAFYKKACDLKFSYGCNNLGTNYYYGQGVSKDLSKSVEFYKKACDLKNGLGCNYLGTRYYYGEGGLPKDLSKSVEFYKKACDLKNGKGCDNLGSRYYSGEGGLPKDLSKAREFYKKACDLGLAKGCNNYATY